MGRPHTHPGRQGWDLDQDSEAIRLYRDGEHHSAFVMIDLEGDPQPYLTIDDGDPAFVPESIPPRVRRVKMYPDDERFAPRGDVKYVPTGSATVDDLMQWAETII